MVTGCGAANHIQLAVRAHPLLVPHASLEEEKLDTLWVLGRPLTTQHRCWCPPTPLDFHPLRRGLRALLHPSLPLLRPPLSSAVSVELSLAGFPSWAPGAENRAIPTVVNFSRFFGIHHPREFQALSTYESAHVEARNLASPFNVLLFASHSAARPHRNLSVQGRSFAPAAAEGATQSALGNHSAFGSQNLDCLKLVRVAGRSAGQQGGETASFPPVNGTPTVARQGDPSCAAAQVRARTLLRWTCHTLQAR
jgi:hypothetical protein